MDRVTRKANLKKLQLPGTGAKQRKTRQSAKTAETTTTISSYFPAPETIANAIDKPETATEIRHENILNINKSEIISKPKTSRVKRTKLDAFIFKPPQSIPTDLKTEPKSLIDDDFELPDKRVNIAPTHLSSPQTNKIHSKTTKPSKRKKQTTIKSAFLRNEQLFAEIAAQHCAADNFSGDDIQMALAISKSEAENNGVIVNDDNVVNVENDVKDEEQNAELIRQKLEKYGFRTAEKKDYNTFAAAFMPKANGRRQRSKWASKFTALTLRDEQLQKKKLQQKIDNFLNQQYRKNHLNAKESSHSKYIFQSNLLKKCNKEMKEKILEHADDMKKPHEQYFVTELFEISNVRPGHLLKDWSAILGRDLTPKKTDPHKRQMIAKMQKIYADLEEYFKCLNIAERPKDNSFVEKEIKLSNEKVNDKITQELQINSTEDSSKIKGQRSIPEIISRKEVLQSATGIASNKTDSHFATTYNNIGADRQKSPEDASEIASVLDSSLKGSMISQLIHLIPPTRTLDLIQVSNITIKTQGETSNACQGPTSNTLHGLEAVTHKTEVFLSDTPKSRVDKCLKHLNEKEKIAATNNSDSSMTSTILNQIQDVIPPTKCLDLMQVSNTSYKSEATNNSTQNTRSNSPDLFADSDVEMEDNDSEVVPITNGSQEKINGISKMSMSDLTTYEIYSSDEVKNTLSWKPPESSLVKEKLMENVIDLTQDYEEEEKSEAAIINHSKTIEEVDIFADSPLHEESTEDIKYINRNSRKSKYLTNNSEETFKFTLSLKGNNDINTNLSKSTQNALNLSFSDDVILRDIDNNQTNTSFLNFKGSKQCIPSFRGTATNKSTENSLNLTLNMDSDIIQECENDIDVVLREADVNEESQSVLDFQAPKQKDRDFHRKTFCKPEVASKQSFERGNDTIFRDLYNKYLGKDAGRRLEQQSFKNHNEFVLRKSFSQIIPNVSTATNDAKEKQYHMHLEMPMEHYMTKRKSMSFNAKTPDKSPISINPVLSKSQSFTGQNISIDLTQTEDDDMGYDEEDDDCLVLSDDEINYSIWKADKTGKFRNSDENSEYEDDDSVENFCLNDNGDAKQTVETNIAKSNNCESSLLDILSEEMSPNKKYQSSQHSYSDFELESPTKNKEEYKLERSNFGILEDFSEPLDFTSNLSTPTKILSEASFLQSPTEFTVGSIKRYSSGLNKTSHKFTELLKSVDNANKFNDYDEFDEMIYENELKKSKSNGKLPQDFNQLMTAEISFKESPEVMTKSKSFSPVTEIESRITILSSKTTSPSKSITEPQELTINNKTYKIRNDESSKPNYALYSEAELLKELYNFGIKPLKRKQAVKILEYIYHQTHPIIIDEAIDDVDIIEDFNLPITTKTAILKSPKSVPSKITSSTTTPASDTENGVGNKLNLNDGCGTDMLRYSMDLKAEQIDEQYILQTNITKKTPQPLMPLHIAWFNLVCSNRKLHENILMYEPIDLQEIYLFLKGLGYRYDPKDLKQFFDRRCIIFRYDLAAAGSQGNKVKGNNGRHVRKKKKTNSKPTMIVNIP